MAHKKIPRNSPCPCGSGKKYKKCCYGKSFDFVEDDEGSVFKSIPITEEMREVLDEQHRKFVETFGREPGPDDKIFFDVPPTELLEHVTVEAMKKAGIDPGIIYAFEQTGLLVTEDNEHLLSEADLAEWEAALDEYDAMPGHTSPPEFPFGTIALYGPDDQRTTKIAAGVILHDGAAPIIERWVASDVTTNQKIQNEIEAFFKKYGVMTVGMSDGNMGCPHEEGKDFPQGGDCPFCPFWKGKQGSNAKE